jgi:hypothetical protein
MLANLLSLHHDTAPVLSTEEPGDQSIEGAAQGRFPRTPLPHHHNKRPILYLALKMIQRGVLTPAIGKCQTFN